MNLAAFLAETGMTYRQLDYWTNTGRVHAHEDRPGTGYSRTWPNAELQVAADMARLIRAGFTLQGAADAARKLATLREWAEIGPGIHLGITP